MYFLLIVFLFCLLCAQVSANDVGSQMSGYLFERIGKKNWKRYWFVLKDRVLYKYKASEDVAAMSSFPILGYQVSTPTISIDGYDRPFLIQVTHPQQPAKIYRYETVDTVEKWLTAMKEASVLSDV